MIEVREVLRAWLAGAGLRMVAAQAGVDRKTARRYVQAAESAGVVRVGGVGQLSDGLIGQVVAAVRPVRPAGYGSVWALLQAEQEQIATWVGKDLTVVKIGELLARRGVVVPYRTLHRFCVQCCGFGRGAATVRVADGEPGVECQIDFGRLGLVWDPDTGRRRVTHALIFTAVYSRQGPGGRWTDPDDLPSEKVGYALRDIDRLIAAARRHGEDVGIYAQQLLDDPLPWTRMRQVYRLLGLARRYGDTAVNTACGRALDVDVVSVTKIASMLEKAAENAPVPAPRPVAAGPARFARDPGEYATGRAHLRLVHSDTVAAPVDDEQVR